MDIGVDEKARPAEENPKKKDPKLYLIHGRVSKKSPGSKSRTWGGGGMNGTGKSPGQVAGLKKRLQT